MATHFKYSQQGVEFEYSRTRRRLISLIVMMILAIVGYNLVYDPLDFHAKGWIVTIVALVFWLGLSFVLLRNRFRLIREGFELFELVLQDDSLTRYQRHLPDLTINRGDVKKITEKPNECLIVRGRNMKDFIMISPSLEDYQQLRELLESWQPIQPSSPLNSMGTVFASVAAFLVISAVFITNQILWVVLLAGTILLAFSGWMFMMMRSNPNVDDRGRRLSWGYVFLFAAVVFRMIVAVITF
jgi:hypothetical protein